MAKNISLLFFAGALLLEVASGGFIGHGYSFSKVNTVSGTHVVETYHSTNIFEDENRVIPGSNFVNNTFSKERNEIFRLFSDMDSSDELLLSFECGEK